MGLKFVQWQIYVSVHETTGQNPFKVTFGEEPRIGLESYVLPKSLVDAAKTEEEVEGFLAFHEANKKESLNRDEKTVPDVDRGPADPKNFQVVIMAECEGLYTVGCREGKLSFKFTAADLQVISENLLSIDEVPDAEIPLRTAVTSATDCHAYVKCMYLSGCSSGRLTMSNKDKLSWSKAKTTTAFPGSY
ncbi:hypothetical protein T01_5572 [Trichinella spiralis]|uniref:Uncharacterized protein n=1 Tax=Trichinella spiralis TaxID=6334 RepID=A0A0V1BVB0_TRISP|nr:hypothetical protein T01_5572 [Trichinella spiralis]